MADGKAFADPDVLRRLTSSVSSALDEAAAALTRMRTQNNGVPSSPNHTTDTGKQCYVENHAFYIKYEDRFLFCRYSQSG